jgi:hypothetical protein
MLSYVALVCSPYFPQSAFDLLQSAEQEACVLATRSLIEQHPAASVVLFEHPHAR